MKSAPFSYVRPGSVQEALQILDEGAGGARVLAGGQSLAPMLQMRLMQLSTLVDINRLPGLAEVTAEGPVTVFGPMVRYATIEQLPLVAERLPLLQCVVLYVGDRQVRNRGTIGGSLAQADPTGEMPLACLALDATVVASSVNGRREIPIDEFLFSAYATSLEPEEMITEIRFPIAPDRFALLRAHPQAQRLRGHQRGCAGTPWRRRPLVGSADRAGRGQRPRGAGRRRRRRRSRARRWTTRRSPKRGRRRWTSAIRPSDVRASAEYRRHLIPIYVRRTLAKLRDDEAHLYG